ncbi:Variant-specific surface protein, partial [Giardia duodenalis]
VCREARDGACMMYKEEVRAERAGAREARNPRAACTPGSGAGQCKVCEAAIGADKYCSECDQTTEAPIDGNCITILGGDICTKNSAKGTCDSCRTGYFLHKGGCYSTAEDKPGRTLCTAASGGVCTTAAAGYFAIPNAPNTGESVVKCDDTTGVEISGNTYKGVQNCEVCRLPATSPGARADSVAVCTKCGNNKYLKDGTCGEASECTGTTFPKPDTSAGNKCLLCGDATNGGIDGCTTCTPKAAAGLAETPSVMCSACTTPTKKPNADGTACVACSIADCANCNEENVCEMCTSNKKLSPLKDACLTDCPAGTYNDNSICKPCHVSCAECNGNANQDSCTACYPGSVLSKSDGSTAGTCIPECTGRYAENCEANQCTANIGGSKYCSRCKSGFVPVDGLCVSSGTTRAPPAGCTPGTDGTCSACTDTYFKESGGCYKAGAFPGNAICTTATGGSCTMCVSSGQNPQGQSCPTCPVGCSKCSGNSGSETCSECLAGYYKSGTSCVKCDKNSTDNKITGVENCVSCAAPTSNTGTVTCYVTQTPTVDPTDPSVNKSGLSSGAIAGISVAAVVVVGGLVGFLCWWFICRGKA